MNQQFQPFTIDFKFGSSILVLDDTDLVHKDIPEVAPGRFYCVIKIKTKNHGRIFLPKYIKKKYINFISSKYKKEYKKVEQIHKEYIDFLLADFL